MTSVHSRRGAASSVKGGRSLISEELLSGSGRRGKSEGLCYTTGRVALVCWSFRVFPRPRWSGSRDKGAKRRQDGKTTEEGLSSSVVRSPGDIQEAVSSLCSLLRPASKPPKSLKTKDPRTRGRGTLLVQARHDDTYDNAALLDLDLSAGHRNTWDDPPLTVSCRISSHLRHVRSMMAGDDEGDTRRVYLEGGLDGNDLATDCSVGGDGDDPTCTRLTTGRARRPSGGVVAPRRPLGAIPPSAARTSTCRPRRHSPTT